MAVEFKTESLNKTVTQGAKKTEAEYASLRRQQYPLKLKFRVGGTAFAKGGKTADRSGVAKPKRASMKHNHVPKIMVVDGRTGKKRMVNA